MKEKYFVAGNVVVPLKIYFNSIDAFISGYTYLDSFDELGNHIKSYKLVDNEYITEF